MEVDFSDANLDRLETDPGFSMKLSPGIVKAYRMRLQGIRSAPDERDFYQLRSWRFERLKGKRKHQHSIRLNDQYRLILELLGSGNDKRVQIVGIEDYH
jgi:proteic killer suppression protein